MILHRLCAAAASASVPSANAPKPPAVMPSKVTFRYKVSGTQPGMFSRSCTGDELAAYQKIVVDAEEAQTGRPAVLAQLEATREKWRSVAAEASRTREPPCTFDHVFNMTQLGIRRYLAQESITLGGGGSKTKKDLLTLFAARFDLDTSGYDLDYRQTILGRGAPVPDEPYRVGWKAGTGGEPSLTGETHLERAVTRYTGPLTDGQWKAIELLVKKFPPVGTREDNPTDLSMLKVHNVHGEGTRAIPAKKKKSKQNEPDDSTDEESSSSSFSQ